MREEFGDLIPVLDSYGGFVVGRRAVGRQEGTQILLRRSQRAASSSGGAL